jgi:hypothetical protein
LPADALAKMLKGNNFTPSQLAILSQPGDLPMAEGVNIPQPTEADFKVINSGIFDQKTFWVSSQAQLSKHNTSQLEASKASVNQTQGFGETYISMQSKFSPSAARPNHAPEDRGLKGPYANNLRRTIEAHPHADGIIVMNEPNLAFWRDKHAAQHSAEMMITADKVMQEMGFKGKLLGPASSDTAHDYGAGFLTEFVAYLNYLGYEFQTEMALAVHIYQGMKHSNIRGIGTAAALARNYLPSDNKQLEATETGDIFRTVLTQVPDVYQYAKHPSLKKQEKLQAERMIYMHGMCRALGAASISNYTFRDIQQGGGGWMCGYYNYDGEPHLIYNERDRLKQTKPISPIDILRLNHIMLKTEAAMSTYN